MTFGLAQLGVMEVEEEDGTWRRIGRRVRYVSDSASTVPQVVPAPDGFADKITDLLNRVSPGGRSAILAGEARIRSITYEPARRAAQARLVSSAEAQVSREAGDSDAETEGGLADDEDMETEAAEIHAELSAAAEGDDMGVGALCAILQKAEGIDTTAQLDEAKDRVVDAIQARVRMAATAEEALCCMEAIDEAIIFKDTAACKKLRELVLSVLRRWKHDHLRAGAHSTQIEDLLFAWGDEISAP